MTAGREKKMKKSEKISTVISFIVILLPLLAGLLLWDKLPDELPIHYNYKGEADNFASKAVAVFGLPLFVFALQAVCLFVSAKIEKKTQAFSAVLLICPAVSLMMGAAVYAESFGFDLDIGTVIIFVTGVLFSIIGNVLPKISRNKTAGIKLPWTLKNDVVWNKTHRLGGFVWFFGGIVLAICAFLPPLVRIISVSVIFAVMILVPTVYSYTIYKKI